MTINYRGLILDAIDNEGFEDCVYFNKCETRAEKISFLVGRFKSEYGWRVKQVGVLNALTDWLQGLALNVPFYNHEILELAGALESSEAAQDMILTNYWKRLAGAAMAMMSGQQLEDLRS